MIQIDETPVLPILFNVDYNEGSRIEFYYFPDSDSTCVSENIFGRKTKKPFYGNALDLTKFYADSNHNEGVVISDVRKRIKKIIKKTGKMDWKFISKQLIATYS